MTRINLTPPETLDPRHLVAEYRELPRVFALIRADDAKRALGLCTPDPGPHYVLGAGHVRFFYDKALWLLTRQRSLIAEMRRRGMNPAHEADETLLDGIDMIRQRRNWAPDAHEIALNRFRINTRLAEMARK